MLQKEQKEYYDEYFEELKKRIFDYIDSGKTAGFNGYQLNLTLLFHLQETVMTKNLFPGGIKDSFKAFKNAWLTRGF